jgi:hypothetical protein
MFLGRNRRVSACRADWGVGGMTELTPAVQDAAHNLGWRLAAMGFSDPFNVPTEQCDALEAAIRAGHAAFTPEAEAERVEAVREADERQQRIDNTLARGLAALSPDEFDVEDAYAARRVVLNDTQGRIPDSP